MSDTIQITEQVTQITIVEEATTVIEVGVQGPRGPVGMDLTYVHEQLVASDVWTINHQLGKYPAITIVDSGGNLVAGDITYNDINTAVAHFSVPFGGKAYCN